MEKSQTNLLLGIAAGGVAVAAGFIIYDQLGISADTLSKGVVTKLDARYIGCSAADAKNSQVAFKGDDGKYYKGDSKKSLTTDLIKDDGKYVKYDGKIFKTDGNKYDAKPALAGDAKSFKNDDGKYLYSDGKGGAITTDSKSLYKFDGKIFAKEDKSLSVSGPVYVVNNNSVICTRDGQAITIDIAKEATAVFELPVAS